MLIAKDKIKYIEGISGLAAIIVVLHSVALDVVEAVATAAADDGVVIATIGHSCYGCGCS